MKVNINKIKKVLKIKNLKVVNENRKVFKDMVEIYTCNWGFKEDIEIVMGKGKVRTVSTEVIQEPDKKGMNYEYLHDIEVTTPTWCVVKEIRDDGDWNEEENYYLIYNPEIIELEEEITKFTKEFREGQEKFYKEIKKLNEMLVKLKTEEARNAVEKEKRKVVIELNKWRKKKLEENLNKIEVREEEEKNMKWINIFCKDDGEYLFSVIKEDEKPQDEVGASYYEILKLVEKKLHE